MMYNNFVYGDDESSHVPKGEDLKFATRPEKLILSELKKKYSEMTGLEMHAGENHLGLSSLELSVLKTSLGSSICHINWIYHWLFSLLYTHHARDMQFSRQIWCFL